MKIVVIPALKQHLEIVRHSIRLIKTTESIEILIVTPDFREYTTAFPSIKILKDSYFQDLSKEEIKAIPGVQLNKINWYYQQILKYSIVIKMEQYEEILILDADTIILNNEIFKDSNSTYYNLNEYNKEYFKLISSLFPEIKILKYSTINNFMWFKRSLLLQMLNSIEEMHQDIWYITILNLVKDKTANAEFSEYELYSNFKCFERMQELKRIKLFRRGDLFLPKYSIETIIETSMKMNLDLISFEFNHKTNWYKKLAARIIVPFVLLKNN